MFNSERMLIVSIQVLDRDIKYKINIQNVKQLFILRLQIIFSYYLPGLYLLFVCAINRDKDFKLDIQ